MKSLRSPLSMALLVLIPLAVAPHVLEAAKPLTVASPDGSLVISLALKSNPQPYLPGERAYYRVVYKGLTILEDSPLGLDFFGARALDKDLEIV